MSAPCEFCGLAHGKICPSVRAIEYHENGKVKRVEFMRPADCHPWPSLAPMLPSPTVVPQPYYPPAVPWWHPDAPGRITCVASQTTPENLGRNWQ